MAVATSAAVGALLEPVCSLGSRDGARLLEALARLCGNAHPRPLAAWRASHEKLTAQPPELGFEHAFAAVATVGQPCLEGGQPVVDTIQMQVRLGEKSELRRVAETQAREPQHLESLEHLSEAAVTVALF